MWDVLLTIATIIVGGIVVMAMAIVLLVGKDRVGSRLLRQKEAAFEFPDLAHKIRNPDWKMVAEVLGEVPPRLKKLYESEVVLEQYLDVVTGKPDDVGAFCISEFEALIPAMRETMWPGLEEGRLTFAGDGFGNQFFLQARAGPKWPVFFHDHEGGEIEKMAASLDAFLLMLRPSEDDS